MGVKLEEIMDRYGLHIHNNGAATYRSGEVVTAPDVTLSYGLTQYGNVSWTILDDDLRSPHEALMLQVGCKENTCRKELINWRDFDWSAYKDLTSTVLNELYQNWLSDNTLQVETMAEEISSKLHECVEAVATKRIITEHSKPWISGEVSKQLKKLRMLRRRSRLRRSPYNVQLYLKAQKDTVEMIQKAEQEW